MTEVIEADVCVIGAGSAGLSVAAGASQMGARTVLFEAGEMGGDCLNTGCVPSKALLAAGKAARATAGEPRYGIPAGPGADFGAVHRAVHDVIAGIAPMDSVERFEGLGVRVVREHARFTGPRTVVSESVEVTAKFVVLATGSRPIVPPVPGLADGPYLTNESVFDLSEAPRHLVILGGGPIGIELAQAHRDLGSAVTVIEMATILGREDPELVGLLRPVLDGRGIVLREGVRATAVDWPDTGGVRVTVDSEAGGEDTIDGSHLLVAVGRSPSVDGLDLEAAGIRYSAKGVEVDRRLRTSNRRVFAIGDVAGHYQFTHVAGYHAGVVIKNALFRLPAKVDYAAVPRVTYTDPELAAVGLDEAEARRRHGGIRVLRWSFAENDRAQAEGTTDGMIKVIATPNGRVVGAAILGPHAGELLQTWSLAIANRIKLGVIASMIAPYPTLSEINKRVAGSFYTAKLFSSRVRKIVRFLLRFA